MSKDNKMDKTIRFRATKEFVELLNHKMEKAKVASYSDYLRESVKSSIINERCENIDKIRYEINKIGINLNQLTKYVHKNGEFDHLAYNEIEKISLNLSHLFEALYNDAN